ncbi:(d)CMP kinase [Mycoplasmopsis opalescens]|uniref:(d)CMP kinase n=1 Tax=Mycoplasmopsis opalescens TaxID=114886 RepID=UPI0004A6BB24|nr:(d)CMP kinase [Mycoplasmopsis opalescens]
MKINIAIDGPSGAGKSTVSQEIAKRINYTFLSSGNVYRAVALYLLEQNIDINNQLVVEKYLDNSKIKLEIKFDESVYITGKNVTNEIREDNVSKAASLIAKYLCVRKFVNDYLHGLTKNDKGFIMDGRDTTYRIMPHAELKIYLTAVAEERARRRVLQNQQMGYETDFNTVYEAVLARDEQDTNREHDALKIVEDAIVLDCTNINFEEVVEHIINLIKTKEKELNA